MTSGLTLNEVALAFWGHAERYYRLLDGSPSRELDHFKWSLRPLLDLFGGTLAAEFGPVNLKTVQQTLINTKKYLVRHADDSTAQATWLPEARLRADENLAQWRQDWLPAKILKVKPALSRRVINQRIDHLKRFFAWAVPRS